MARCPSSYSSPWAVHSIGAIPHARTVHEDAVLAPRALRQPRAQLHGAHLELPLDLLEPLIFMLLRAEHEGAVFAGRDARPERLRAEGRVEGLPVAPVAEQIELKNLVLGRDEALSPGRQGLCIGAEKLRDLLVRRQ